MSPHISLLYQSIQKVTHSKFKCFKFYVDILIPVLFIFQSINIMSASRHFYVLKVALQREVPNQFIFP